MTPPMPHPITYALLLSSLLAWPSATEDPLPPAAAPSLEVVVYDVSELVSGVSAKEGRADVMPAEGTIVPMKFGVPPRPLRVDPTARLAGLLKHFAPLADSEDIFTIPEGEGLHARLAVLAGAETHAWMRSWLTLQRGADMIEVEARFIEIEGIRLEELDIDLSGATAGMAPAERDRLMEALKERQAEVIAAPRIRMRPASSSQLSALETISYVQDWHLVTVEPGPYEVAVPVIGTLEEGTRMEALGLLLPDGTIGLELAISRSEMIALRPFELTLRKEPAEVVQLALPEVKISSVDTRVVLADGAAVLLGGLATGGDQRMAFLIEARVVRPRIEGEGEDR